VPAMTYAQTHRLAQFSGLLRAGLLLLRLAR
jgi:hypothetical protein